MSAIAGIFYRDGQPARRSTPETMLSRLQARGPDGCGIWCGGPVGLAHCLLHTTPQSLHERQPKLSDQADLVLVADARLDNRDELIGQLSISRRTNLEIPDGAILLKAYQTWEEACLEKIIGDFAFAVWDSKRKLVFCARDAVGVKPFYYSISPRLFAFASRISALLVLSELPHRLNERKVADYLLWDFEDTAGTFYQDINRLTPGHCLTVTVDAERINRYWSLDAQHELHLKDPQEYIDGFKQIFTEAVKSRTRSVYSLGSMLSGGLDSSSIACIVSQMQTGAGSGPLKVFSAVFPDLPEAELKRVDERFYIGEVARSGAFYPISVRADQISPFIVDPDDLQKILDEPFFAPTQFLFWSIYQAAQKEGVRVLLDGTDGDSTVSHGLEHFADLARMGRWKTIYQEAAELANHQNTSRSVRSTIWQYAVAPILPPAAVRMIQRLRGIRGGGWSGQGLIKLDFARRMGIEERSTSGIRDPYLPLTNAREKHAHEMTNGLIPMGLELFDKLSAVFSIDVRYPFFDRRLMEYCLALPPEMKFSHGWTRYVLRAAMEGILPSRVQWRTGKADLPAAFAWQMLGFERSRIEQILTHPSDALLEYIDRQVLNEAGQRYLSMPTRYLTEANTIFGVIALESWLKTAGFG